jgi:hypothetical protein
VSGDGARPAAAVVAGVLTVISTALVDYSNGVVPPIIPVLMTWVGGTAGSSGVHEWLKGIFGQRAEG